jgi:hypothetical protein
MKKRHAILPFILALGAGCFFQPEHELEPGTPLPEPEPGRSLDFECQNRHVERGREALALIAECASDADCVVAGNSSNCLTPFICNQAIARGNEAALEAVAGAAVEAYLAECGNFCAVADCVGEQQLRAKCDTSIGQCALEVLPFEPVSEDELAPPAVRGKE